MPWRRMASKLKEIKANWQDYPLAKGQVWAERYIIESFLGMGSYGQAYTAVDKRNGQLVLLKRNKPSKGTAGISLLRREDAIMQAVEHPQIPRRIDYVRHGSGEALIMAYIPAPNLELGIHELGLSFTAAEALALLKEVLQPLKRLHEAGYVHRDVRIPNVLLHEGLPYLIDFGLACKIGERLPEGLRQALGEDEWATSWSGMREDSGNRIKRRMREPQLSSDWFGLGHLFLFLMYAGYTPEEGREERSWEEELELPAEVVAFVRKLLGGGADWTSMEQCERELDLLLARLRGAGSL